MASTKLPLRLGAAAAAAALLAAGPSAHAANLLVNGSFEDLTHFVDQGADTNSPNAGDSTTLVGWTVFNDSVSWIGPTNPFGVTASPSGGSYFLDLSGFHNGNPDGGVRQTIATVAGSTYLLTFDLGSSLFYGLQDGVHVTAGGASADFLSTNSGQETNLWETESLSFMATGSSTTISFLGNVGANYVGLDNVSVTGATSAGVPEPAAWALMLMGFGGLGAMLRRRRLATA